MNDTQRLYLWEVQKGLRRQWKEAVITVATELGLSPEEWQLSPDFSVFVKTKSSEEPPEGKQG